MHIFVCSSDSTSQYQLHFTFSHLGYAMCAYVWSSVGASEHRQRAGSNQRRSVCKPHSELQCLLWNFLLKQKDNGISWGFFLFTCRSHSQHVQCHDLINGLNTFSKICSRRRKGEGWAGRHLLSQPYPSHRKPVMSPPAAPHLNRRRRVSTTSTLLHLHA